MITVYRRAGQCYFDCGAQIAAVHGCIAAGAAVVKLFVMRQGGTIQLH
ncbi:MAG: hypothetical protein HP477_06690 [Nitrospira sp.]|nr:hypothetical protein [Nitrospira sp.]